MFSERWPVGPFQLSFTPLAQTSSHTTAEHTARLTRFYALTRTLNQFLLATTLHKNVGWPAALIWNLDTAKNPQSHWVAVCIDLRGHGYYFDSYGFPSLRKETLNTF